MFTPYNIERAQARCAYWECQLQLQSEAKPYYYGDQSVDPHTWGSQHSNIDGFTLGSINQIQTLFMMPLQQYWVLLMWRHIQTSWRS